MSTATQPLDEFHPQYVEHIRRVLEAIRATKDISESYIDVTNAIEYERLCDDLRKSDALEESEEKQKKAVAFFFASICTSFCTLHSLALTTLSAWTMRGWSKAGRITTFREIIKGMISVTEKLRTCEKVTTPDMQTTLRHVVSYWGQMQNDLKPAPPGGTESEEIILLQKTCQHFLHVEYANAAPRSDSKKVSELGLR